MNSRRTMRLLQTQATMMRTGTGLVAVILIPMVLGITTHRKLLLMVMWPLIWMMMILLNSLLQMERLIVLRRVVIRQAHVLKILMRASMSFTMTPIGIFLGGMDKFDNGATITIYDENWNATTSVDEAAAFANLTLSDVDASAFDALPSDFLKAIGVDTETSTSETVNITVTVDADTDTDNPVFLFSDAAINPARDNFNEGDVYVFDVSALDYSFVLASDAAGTPLTAGVVTSDDGEYDHLYSSG